MKEAGKYRGEEHELQQEAVDEAGRGVATGAC